jgi:hypothetical protein
MDGQSKPIRYKLAAIGMPLNTASNEEHVPEIEKSNRTVKEWVRSVYATPPFKKLPVRFSVEMVAGCILWLNAFPAMGGVSPTMSPRAIVTGSKLDYNQQCQMQCGEPYNKSMARRTVGAIGLRPTGNSQGGYYYLSLKTGRRLNMVHCTPLPMPAGVIDRVHTMARRSPEGLTFGNRNNMIPVHDDDDGDVSDEGDDESDYDSDADSDYEPGHHSDDNDNDNASDTSDSNTSDSGSDYLPNGGSNDDNDDDGGDDDDKDNDDAANRDSGSPNEGEHEDHPLEEESTGVPNDDDHAENADTVPEGQRLRRNRHANYSDMSMVTHLKTVGYSSLMRGISGVKDVTMAYVNIAFAISEFNKVIHDAVNPAIISQYGMKKDMRLFG